MNRARVTARGAQPAKAAKVLVTALVPVSALLIDLPDRPGCPYVQPDPIRSGRPAVASQGSAGHRAASKYAAAMHVRHTLVHTCTRRRFSRGKLNSATMQQSFYMSLYRPAIAGFQSKKKPKTPSL